MNEIKTIFKKGQWMYGFSALVAIYFSYLFVRTGIFEIRSAIIISGVAVGLAELVTRHFLNRSLSFRVDDRRVRTKFFVGVLAIAIVITWCGRVFLSYTYTDCEVHIESSRSGEISLNDIDTIIVGNVVYKNDGTNFVSEYDASVGQNDGWVKSIVGEDEIVVQVKKSSSVKIMFSSTHEDLVVTDGEKVTDIVVSNRKDIYVVSSNKRTDIYSIVRAVLSLASVYYVFMIVSIFIVNARDKREKYLILTGLIACGIGLFYLLDSYILLTPDSYEYIDFDFGNILRFRPNERVLLYPLVISIMKVLFSNRFLEFTVLFQYAVWLISIVYLYKTIELLTRKPMLSMVGSIVYAIAPFAVVWNGCILTESLALSMTNIFIYYMLAYVKNNRTIYGIVSIILSLVMTFIRPTSLIFLLGILAFFILRFIFDGRRKSDMTCIKFNGCALILVGLYAICFNNVYGFYSISSVMPRQQLMVVMREGFYKKSSDEEFITNVEEAYESTPGSEIKYSDFEWSAMKKVLEKYSLVEVRERTRECFKKNRKEYISYLVGLILSYSTTNFFGYGGESMNPATSFIRDTVLNSFALLTFMHVYILICVQIFMTIVEWVKTRKIPWIHCGLFVFPMVIVLSSFMGTCAEFMRTAACCVPFAYLIFIATMSKLFNGGKENL